VSGVRRRHGGVNALTEHPPGDAEVGEQERDRFGGHRRAEVGADTQLAAADVLLADRLGEHPLGQDRRLPRGIDPGDRVAGEDVQRDIEGSVRALEEAEGCAPKGSDIPRQMCETLVIPEPFESLTRSMVGQRFEGQRRGHGAFGGRLHARFVSPRLSGRTRPLWAAATVRRAPSERMTRGSGRAGQLVEAGDRER